MLVFDAFIGLWFYLYDWLSKFCWLSKIFGGCFLGVWVVPRGIAPPPRAGRFTSVSGQAGLHKTGYRPQQFSASDFLSCLWFDLRSSVDNSSCLLCVFASSGLLLFAFCRIFCQTLGIS